MYPENPAEQMPPRPARIAALDVLRGLALLAMASYHFTWDLEFFGYVEPGLTSVGAWKLYARCIASTFLFLVGASLVLAHGGGIRWRGFFLRLAMIVASAAAISAVTYFMMPEGFIFFGILHEIAAASLLGLLFLRLPAPATLLAAAVVVALPFLLRHAAFDHPALWWVGLSTFNPRSNDYVPIFPWFGAVLAGMAAMQMIRRTGLPGPVAAIGSGPRWQPLRFLGRHSLAFYLVHQPFLFGAVWLVAQFYPAPQIPRDVQFRISCERNCAETRDATFCTRYCGCMLDALQQEGKLDAIYGTPDEELRRQVGELAEFCTLSGEGEPDEEAEP